MSSEEQRLARRRARRNPFLRPLAAVAAGLLVLIIGIAIGRALEDGPAPGGIRTSVRTLKPQPLPPAAKTVTVTVGSG